MNSIDDRLIYKERQQDSLYPSSYRTTLHFHIHATGYHLEKDCRLPVLKNNQVSRNQLNLSTKTVPPKN